MFISWHSVWFIYLFFMERPILLTLFKCGSHVLFVFCCHFCGGVYIMVGHACATEHMWRSENNCSVLHQVQSLRDMQWRTYWEWQESLGNSKPAQGHTFSNKATPPHPSQTLPPTGPRIQISEPTGAVLLQTHLW